MEEVFFVERLCMAITQHWTVIGIFDTQEQARQAMTDLQQAGFQDDQIGFVYRDVPHVSKADTVEPEETASAFTGGIAGGILGAVDALLTPVLGPSVANTIPESSMPAVEQVIDRFQHMETSEKVHEDEPVTREQQRDTIATPSSLSASARELPDEAEVVTREEQKLEGEDVATVTQAPPVEQEKAVPNVQRVREDEATGAITGGIVGGVLGIAVSLLIPVLGPAFAGGFLVTVFSAALGAVAGSFWGAFVGLGVPAEEARHYEHEFKQGRTILTVKTDDHQQEALGILHRHGARYANAHSIE
jgi:uncharacterized membrane protein